MKHTNIFLCYLILLTLTACNKKDGTNTGTNDTDFVDGKYNGKYTLEIKICNYTRYLTDIEGSTAFVSGQDRYHMVTLSTVANEELPWYFQKLKNGKYIIYSKRKNGKYYLWNFRELKDINETSPYFPGPSNIMVLEVMPSLPEKPDVFYQFEIFDAGSGNLPSPYIGIRGGSRHVSCWGAAKLPLNHGGSGLCTVYPITNTGGPVLTFSTNDKQIEVPDGLGNLWGYGFWINYLTKKIP